MPLSRDHANRVALALIAAIPLGLWVWTSAQPSGRAWIAESRADLDHATLTLALENQGFTVQGTRAKASHHRFPCTKTWEISWSKGPRHPTAPWGLIQRICL